jgi:uncharacterized protein YggE
MKYNALLLCGFFFLATPAFAEPAPTRMISVTGEASEDVAPDQAALSGQLVSKSKQLSSAKQENDKLAERVLAIAKQFDIPKNKISASNVYISPEYIYNNKTNKQEMIGYIVSRNLSITMDKLEIHERVLSALIENGIEQINGVSFTIANADARGDALRVKAVENARTRAGALAVAAGAKLGKVVSISMAGAAQPPMLMMGGAPMAKMAMAESSVAPSLPGTNRLYESVSVTFELE